MYTGPLSNRRTGRERLRLSLPVFTLLWCDPYDRDAMSTAAIEAAVSCHHPDHFPADTTAL